MIGVKKLGLGAAVVGLVAAGAGIGFASIPDSSTGVITACYRAGATVRVIDAEAGQTCLPGETKLTWNQTGPQGAAGSQGPAGHDAPNPAPNSVVIGTATMPGVTGGNPDGSFNVLSYSQGLSRPPAVTGTGGGATKATLTPFTVTKAVDVATPALARIAFVGTHVQQVTINISSGGSNNSPTQYTLDNVTVTNYQLSQSGAEGAGQLEQLTLSFDTITITVGTNTTCINTVTGATC